MDDRKIENDQVVNDKMTNDKWQMANLFHPSFSFVIFHLSFVIFYLGALIHLLRPRELSPALLRQPFVVAAEGYECGGVLALRFDPAPCRRTW